VIAEEYRKKYEDYIGKLLKEIKSLKKTVASLEKDARKGQDFQTMLTAIDENPVVKHSWDRFMMSMRITENG
jgi:hypothetical protein